MKVGLICGSWPPERCGVADYSRQLALALGRQGVDVVELDSRSAASGAARQRMDIAHIQVPAVGFDRFGKFSLLPFRVGSRRVVTLHEYSIFSLLRRASVLPFALLDARIFTNEVERDSYASAVPLRTGRDLIIHIGSNIPRGSSAERIARSICTFGLIMPGKGLEQFLQLAEILKTRAEYQLSIIGAAPAHSQDYAETIIARARALGIDVLLDRSPDEVAQALAQHQFTYQPFPDGASVKRGSLIAGMVNGAVALSTFGRMTPEWMKDLVLEARSPEEAAEIVEKLSADESRLSLLRSRTEESARMFDWDGIAQRHVELYDSLLRRDSRAKQPAAA
jgi:glycosyltransferase involved in cell wall biosynthesis